jgi:TrmH family RNA methyltransferase
MFSKTHTKYIQSLQHKKFRDAHAVFIAEGPKVVLDLLASRKFVCKEVFAVPEWLDENAAQLKTYTGTSFEAIKDFELEKISALTTPHQVLAIFEQHRTDPDIVTAGKITLVLDSIQDPGNMGTIIRIADWFAVQNIVCSTGSADMYNPKVVQSTMGSLARVNIIYTNLYEWLQANRPVKSYAAALEGKDVKTLQNIGEGIIIIGNESRGISENILASVNEKITIAKKGRAESLNAAVAAGIILSHIS